MYTLFDSFFAPPTIVVVSEERLKAAELKAKEKQLLEVKVRIAQLQEFYDKLDEAFKIGNINSDKINYYLPYVDKKKYNIVEDAKSVCDKLGLNFEFIFKNSISCYNGTGCGKCGACNDRKLAFKKVNLKDPGE